MSYDEEQLSQPQVDEAQTTSEQPTSVEPEASAPPQVTAPPPIVEHAAPEREYSMEMAMSGGGFGEPFKRLARGQVVEGTVVQVNKDLVLVDVGTKSEGIIPLAELSNENLQSTEGVVAVGDKITVVVVQSENSEGNPVLSKRRADFQDAWDKIEEALHEKRTIPAMVVERVKGGLVVDVGVRGFVPATHVHDGKQRNIERFVGLSLPLKVLEIDRERRKVVLSNKLAQDEINETKKVEIFGKIKPGMRLSGVVSRIVDYGAFVDLGGTDGLLHVSEMSWTRINHPSDALKEGEEIEVMVLRVDPEKGKISLGRRQVLPDPWSLVAENYRPGQTITVPITRVVQNGAFAKLPEGVEGFIHVSEMALRRVGRPNDVVSEGQTVDVKVLEINAEERRMSLSIKALLHQEERQEVQKHTPRPQHGGGTIGDRLGDLRGLLMEDDLSEVVGADDLADLAGDYGRPAAEAPVEATGEPETSQAGAAVDADASSMPESAANAEAGETKVDTDATSTEAQEASQS